ncbi:MAG TPA: vWA domain-containing protein [Streptosporangiaceae bacterium]|nr:vWA domain-containing protein [Streptosporangiaceae bacterium]
MAYLRQLSRIHSIALRRATSRLGQRAWSWLRRGVSSAATLLLVLMTVPQPASAQPVADAGQVGARAGGGLPLNMVILVDESGSESSLDISHEAQAASTIAQSVLNPQSRVSVVGFGGADAVAPRADPTAIVCQPTTTSGTGNLEYLARCVGGLRPRTAAEGNNTDYYGALGQALSILSGKSVPGALNVILMMTDGGLDEDGNKSFPQPNWQVAAHAAINRELAGAGRGNISVWPLGFGSIDSADQGYLQHLAHGGGQVTCDGRQVSQPRATLVQDSASALSAFDALYSAAACIGTNNSGPGDVPPGGSHTLTVSIPPIASTAAISVYKSDPDVRVDFIAPGGVPVTGGTLDGSRIELSGSDTTVEVLHVVNPPAGPWQIRLSAPPGRHGDLVSATVFWQGQIRTSVTALPSTAAPGQKISVTLTVLGRNHPIVDPAELKGVAVQASVTGGNLPDPLPIRLSHSTAPGTTAGDFTGTFRAPSAKGLLTITGTASGYGLHATKILAFVSVVNAATIVQATVQFPAVETVLAGSPIKGQVLFTNRTGQAQRARLVLAPGSALATIASPPGSLRIPPGRSVYHFTIRVATGTPTGTAQFILAAVDASKPTSRYGYNSLVVAVRQPPSLLRKYLWELVLAVALVLLAAGLLYKRQHESKRGRDVRGLVAVLQDDHGSTRARLKAPRKQSSQFRFVITKPDGEYPLLAYPGAGNREPVYVARRDGQGNVVVTTPQGRDLTMAPGTAGERISATVRLTFHDTRAARQAARSDGPKATAAGQQASGGSGDYFTLT